MLSPRVTVKRNQYPAAVGTLAPGTALTVIDNTNWTEVREGDGISATLSNVLAPGIYMRGVVTLPGQLEVYVVNVGALPIDLPSELDITIVHTQADENTVLFGEMPSRQKFAEMYRGKNPRDDAREKELWIELTRNRRKVLSDPTDTEALANAQALLEDLGFEWV